LAPPTQGSPPAPRYAAVIDAGSSGSRIHVYRWWPGAPLPRVEEAWRLKIEPGLSAFVGDAAAIAEHLTPLIEFALDRIAGEGGAPEGRPVLLLEATGGVRALEAPAREELLTAVRSYLETTPFEVGGVEVIDGRSEGLFGWITVNYLLGRLAASHPTAGALDLGGVSTQITFEPRPQDSEGSRAGLRLGDREWRLYARSYAGLGQELALEAAATPACYPPGYPLDAERVGRGDYVECRREVLAFLGPRVDPHQPAVAEELYAFSGFYYAADFFGLEDGFSLAALEAAGIDYCARPWSEIEREHRDRLAWDPYVPRRCFTAAYLVALLHDGYGVALESERIHPVSSLAGQDVGWTLGALLFELADGRIR